MTTSVRDQSPDVLHAIQDVGDYRISVVRCTRCHRCWVRSVHLTARKNRYGVWLCPRGWRAKGGCGSRTFMVVNRPEAESLWRLTGAYGFGDMEGHP